MAMRKVRHVRDPDFTTSAGSGEPVAPTDGGNRATATALRGLRFEAAAWSRAQASRSHESPHSAFAQAMAPLAKTIGKPWPAIGLPTLSKSLLQFCDQLGILLLAAAGTAIAPIVITTTRNRQHLAEHSHGMLGRQSLNLLIACFHVVERMPRDFFKISRCSVTRSNSALSRRFSASSSEG